MSHHPLNPHLESVLIPLKEYKDAYLTDLTLLMVFILVTGGIAMSRVNIMGRNVIVMLFRGGSRRIYCIRTDRPEQTV